MSSNNAERKLVALTETHPSSAADAGSGTAVSTLSPVGVIQTTAPLTGRRLRIDSRKRWFPDLLALFRARQLLMVLGRRDVTVKYRQTVLGTLWIFAGPVVSAGLFTFVFGNVANLPSGGVPYFAFSYAGLLGWNLFSNTLSGTSASLTQNSGLISKIYFPRLTLPLSTMGSTLVNTAVSFGIMLMILALYRIPLTLHLLTLPFWLLLAMFLAFGIGFSIGAGSVKYRDVNYVLPIFTQIVLYLSPVAYSIQAIPKRLHTLYLFNPFTTIVEGCRWSLLGQGTLTGWAIVYTTVLTTVVFVGGLSIFARLEWNFADVI